MKDLHKAIDLISAERILKVVSFLKWEELSTLMNGRVRQFVSPDDEYTALIPLSNEFSDYYKVITDTLQSIASYENRSLESLINRILNPSYDILKWRIADNYTKEGKIPFFKMTEAIDNIKDILAISCLDTLSPSKFHAKVYTNDVNDNISNYSFGQTEIGSYILNILCPLGNYHYEIFEPTEENIPLNRKINIKLISSIYNIQEDLNADNKNKFDEEVDQGIYSINFLDSLMSIYEDTKDTEMNIIVDWCKDVKFIKISLTRSLIHTHLYKNPPCVQRSDGRNMHPPATYLLSASSSQMYTAADRVLQESLPESSRDRPENILLFLKNAHHLPLPYRSHRNDNPHRLLFPAYVSHLLSVDAILWHLYPIYSKHVTTPGQNCW